MNFVCSFTAPPLTFLINQRFKSGVFPCILEKNSRSPFFETSEITEIQDRLARFLTLEKCLRTYKKNYNYNYIFGKQIVIHKLGFWNGISTADAIACLTEELYNTPVKVKTHLRVSSISRRRLGRRTL